LGPWPRALMQAVALLLVVHVFVVRWVMVESTSMFATLRPGDLLTVQRWPIWTGFERGDIVVFRDPLRDDVNMSARPLLVKRIAGMPGDVVQLRDGLLFVNDERDPLPSTGTYAYLVRLRSGRSPVALVDMLGLPQGIVRSGRSFIELPLNAELADSIGASPDVVAVERMSSATGAPAHIFPFSRRFAWNSDDYGPITIPRKGDTLRIDVDNIPLYDRLIGHYEGHTLQVDGNELLMDGAPLDRYVVEQDYYFVLGDSRHYSADSRFWGFLPADHLVGRGGPVLIHAH
ncbi:MAG: signal peptidase I, partial [Flavobacteriales bacterium]|nr:signal peptidase I [Flavobacteriales bacterium]